LSSRRKSKRAQSDAKNKNEAKNNTFRLRHSRGHGFTSQLNCVAEY
jgi:hypothetical protein